MTAFLKVFIAFQGHSGMDGLKGQPGAQGVKVNTELGSL
jgi:hypothetical protein